MGPLASIPAMKVEVIEIVDGTTRVTVTDFNREVSTASRPIKPEAA